MSVNINDIFSCQGNASTKTLPHCSKGVKRDYMKEVKGYVAMSSSSTDKIDITSLGTNPYLVFHTIFPNALPVKIEMNLSDYQKVRRRLVFSSSFRAILQTELHVQIPLSFLPTDQWLNIVFHLNELHEMLFNTPFVRCDSITVTGMFKVKRIYSTKIQPVLNDIIDSNIPPSHILLSYPWVTVEPNTINYLMPVVKEEKNSDLKGALNIGRPRSIFLNKTPENKRIVSAVGGSRKKSNVSTNSNNSQQQPQLAPLQSAVALVPPQLAPNITTIKPSSLSEKRSKRSSSAIPTGSRRIVRATSPIPHEIDGSEEIQLKSIKKEILKNPPPTLLQQQKQLQRNGNDENDNDDFVPLSVLKRRRQQQQQLSPPKPSSSIHKSPIKDENDEDFIPLSVLKKRQQKQQLDNNNNLLPLKSLPTPKKQQQQQKEHHSPIDMGIYEIKQSKSIPVNTNRITTPPPSVKIEKHYQYNNNNNSEDSNIATSPVDVDDDERGGESSGGYSVKICMNDKYSNENITNKDDSSYYVEITPTITNTIEDSCDSLLTPTQPIHLSSRNTPNTSSRLYDDNDNYLDKSLNKHSKGNTPKTSSRSYINDDNNDILNTSTNKSLNKYSSRNTPNTSSRLYDDNDNYLDKLITPSSTNKSISKYSNKLNESNTSLSSLSLRKSPLNENDVLNSLSSTNKYANKINDNNRINTKNSPLKPIYDDNDNDDETGELINLLNCRKLSNPLKSTSDFQSYEEILSSRRKSNNSILNESSSNKNIMENSLKRSGSDLSGKLNEIRKNSNVFQKYTNYEDNNTPLNTYDNYKYYENENDDDDDFEAIGLNTKNPTVIIHNSAKLSDSLNNTNKSLKSSSNNLSDSLNNTSTSLKSSSNNLSDSLNNTNLLNNNSMIDTQTNVMKHSFNDSLSNNNNNNNNKSIYKDSLSTNKHTIFTDSLSKQEQPQQQSLPPPDSLSYLPPSKYDNELLLNKYSPKHNYYNPYDDDEDKNNNNNKYIDMDESCFCNTTSTVNTTTTTTTTTTTDNNVIDNIIDSDNEDEEIEENVIPVTSFTNEKSVTKNEKKKFTDSLDDDEDNNEKSVNESVADSVELYYDPKTKLYFDPKTGMVLPLPIEIT